MGINKERLELELSCTHYVNVGLLNLESESLPSPPRLLVRALDLYSCENKDISDYIALIQSDPSTSLRVYKLGYSVMYSTQLVSKKQPVLKAIAIRLGIASLENLVVSSLMEQSFQSNSKHANSLLFSVWGKSIFIAKSLEFNGGDYLTGLLCQVGVLPILHELEKSQTYDLDIDETVLVDAISVLTPKLLSIWGFKALSLQVAELLTVSQFNKKSLNAYEIAVLSYDAFKADSDDYLLGLGLSESDKLKVESTIVHASTYYKSLTQI